MSHNPNFYNNICGNFTFQRFAPPYVPPPPPPPAYFIPPSQSYTPEKSDHEFLKTFECKIQPKKPKIAPTISISHVREQLRNAVLMLNDLKDKEKMLENQVSSLTDEEWTIQMDKIVKNKKQINEILSNINGSYLDVLRKLLAKRSANRLRLKRVRIENKKDKEEMIKESKERSRKIDENLQKIKDEISKAKQEEEAKIQADTVLKEVLRKKQDAKKCIVKLDALVKLRKARQNTAKGRGENVSESDSLAFNSNIEKLKSVWTRKLSMYEKEEAELRATLREENERVKAVNEMEREVEANLEEWREELFGGKLPQVEFGGDVGRFVAVRSQWDCYVSSEGSSLPVGWVLPSN